MPAGSRPSSRRWSTRSGRRRARGARATAGIEYGTAGGTPSCGRGGRRRSRSAARSPASGMSSCVTPTVAGRPTAGSPAHRCAAGDVVAARSVVGTTDGHFHFGLRDGDVYLDPAPYLGRLVGRPRLVPTDGTAARPAPPHAAMRCRQRRDGVASVGVPDSVAAGRYRPVGRCLAASTSRPPVNSGRFGADREGRNRTRRIPWPSSPCARCSKPVSTSGTRPAGGTRR